MGDTYETPKRSSNPVMSVTHETYTTPDGAAIKYSVHKPDDVPSSSRPVILVIPSPFAPLPVRLPFAFTNHTVIVPQPRGVGGSSFGAVQNKGLETGLGMSAPTVTQWATDLDAVLERELAVAGATDTAIVAFGAACIAAIQLLVLRRGEGISKVVLLDPTIVIPEPDEGSVAWYYWLEISECAKDVLWMAHLGGREVAYFGGDGSVEGFSGSFVDGEVGKDAKDEVMEATRAFWVQLR
ncbi:hypothetical protein HDU85_004110 [Gaertneriomyces sp. JEL0708]|nr:hypothetical protein HDU85_004110 [Gaertneriomyces sp. JEL0708]